MQYHSPKVSECICLSVCLFHALYQKRRIKMTEEKQSAIDAPPPPYSDNIQPAQEQRPIEIVQHITYQPPQPAAQLPPQPPAQSTQIQSRRRNRGCLCGCVEWTCICILEWIFVVLFPPIAVAIDRGCGTELLLNIILTICGYIPGTHQILYKCNFDLLPLMKVLCMLRL